jgi:hypothetical protein
MKLQRAKVRNKEDSSALLGSESVVRNNVKDKLCRSLSVLVLCTLLFPFCVSAQCGECDDRDPCTEDYCNGTQCLHAPKSCGDESLSTWKPLEVNANISVPEKVGNSNPYINFTSSNGAVFNAAVSCNDGNPCTTDYYGASGCVHDPVNCDDKNPCTTDYCGANGCVHNPLICADGNAGAADVSGSCSCGNALLNGDKGNASALEPGESSVSETYIRGFRKTN